MEKNPKELFVVTVYDEVARDSSNLMLLKTLDLVPRLLRASRLNADIDDYNVYLIGIFNPETREFRPCNELINTLNTKESIKKGNLDETSR